MGELTNQDRAQKLVDRYEAGFTPCLEHIVTQAMDEAEVRGAEKVASAMREMLDGED